MSNLILYHSAERAFATNGIGILADLLDSETCEELNGQFELSVIYPITGRRYLDLIPGRIITAVPDPIRNAQPFRIYGMTKPLSGRVGVYARHVAYDLKKIVVMPFKASSAAAAFQGLKANAVNDCPFEFWTDMDIVGEFEVKVPTDIWTLLGGSKGSILDVYGGEYEFDGFQVKLHSHRGADRGVTIRYGKNLTDFKQEESIANTYNGVYPYWTDGDGDLVELPEKVIRVEGEWEQDNIRPLDLSSYFDEKPSISDLRERAEKFIDDNDIGKPAISWTIGFLQLEQTEEYKGKALLERVILGDTVRVPVSKLNVDVTARAVAVWYQPHLDRYKDVSLGSVRATLADTIVQQGKGLQNVPTSSQLQQSQRNATNWITNGKGCIVAVRGEAGIWHELCILDTPDINTAINVWRWSNSGLGFSPTGYSGPYTQILSQADGKTELTIDRINGKTVSWAANGDGTLSLVAAE